MTTSPFKPIGILSTPLTRRAVDAIRGYRWLVCVGGLLMLLASESRVIAAPLNDSFASASTLFGATNRVEVSSVGASAEVGERSRVGNPAASSVWWRWTAPDTGMALVTTLGSGFDTVLAVYAGDAIDSLELVAENDDAPGVGTSAVAFHASQGREYRIVVDGYQGATGDLRLGLFLPVQPTLPRIILQPKAWTIEQGSEESVNFRVEATGTHPLVYEWQKDGAPLASGTNSIYTIERPSIGDAGEYRVMVRNTLGDVISDVALLKVLEEVDHDGFATRSPLDGPSNVGIGHNLGASLEAGEPIHGGVPNGGSLWWSWTAPSNGLVRVDTLGSTGPTGHPLDTVLAVYTGDDLKSLMLVASNNDGYPAPSGPSRLVFRAVAGVTYPIAVAGVLDPSGEPAEGFIEVRLEQLPDNDSFKNALTIPPGQSRVWDDNRGASDEVGEPHHVGNRGGKSVWWTWTAPVDGTVVIDTVGSGIDTVLALYTGDALGELILVGEDDNRSGERASLVKFTARGGTAYRIAVDGYLGPQGVEAGSIVLNVRESLEPNDDFTERLTLVGRTNRIRASNVGAGKEPGEPNHGGNAGGRSVWWSWTARVDGPVMVSTRNSDFDTALAVYTGSTISSLVLIGENDDSDPLHPEIGSHVEFLAIAGQTYQIAVDGYRDETGSIGTGQLALELIQRLPPTLGGNDDFVNRFVIVGQSNVLFGLNHGATLEKGEPAHGGNDGGRSVWWSWVAPATAAVRIDTIGSDFDTVLAVYRGETVDALTLVACDLRSAGGGRSLLFFEAVQGAEYQIAIDGFNNGDAVASGHSLLRVQQFSEGALHANDDFEQASPIAPPFLSVLGSNIGATRQVGEPAHVKEPTGHSVWWTWTAEWDGPVTVSTAESPLDTLLSVYTGTSLGTLSLVAENDDVDPGTVQSSVTFEALAGVTYRIAVDGYENKIGLIGLRVTPGPNSPQPPTVHESPVSQTRFAGGKGGGTEVRFRVVATGTPPMSYQWMLDGDPLTGQTGPELILPSAVPSDSGRYEVWVSNGLGTARSEVAHLAVLAAEFNDDFESRLLVTGISNAVRGSGLGATKQPGEPHHGGEVGGRSVWWSWEAPSDGLVEIHTLGSTIDTLLGVYVGEAVDRLTRIAENDDMVPDAIFASRVVIQATAGRRYHIAVDAAKTRTMDGAVMLTIRPPTSLRQQIAIPVIESGGRVRLTWSDAEGIAAGDAGRFEVEYTTSLESEPVVWVKHPAAALLREGRFVFEDAINAGEPGRFYRVREKPVSR